MSSTDVSYSGETARPDPALVDGVIYVSWREVRRQARRRLAGEDRQVRRRLAARKPKRRRWGRSR